jgi:uncharacterized membrane protein HdeD (DUF308 family)
MPNEKTPLTYTSTTTTMMASSNNNSTTATNNNSSSLTETISKFAQLAFTKENLEAAGAFTKEKALELKKEAQDGDHSLRFLALIGGLACVVVGLLELISRFMRLDVVGSLIDLYIVILGLIVIILEGKNMLLSAQFVERIHKYALFLKFLWGRGALYFVIGTLQLYQIDLLNLISGGWMCFVGVLYILVGRRTANKLKSLKKNIYSEHTLRTKYHEANIEGDGLNLSQFRGLCFNLGLDLTRRETEAAFDYISRKSSGEKLCYEDFQAWWNESDVDERIDDSFTYNFV